MPLARTSKRGNVSPSMRCYPIVYVDALYVNIKVSGRVRCVDGLTGFPQAIEAVYPDTQVPLCIVHLIRNGLRYVPWKDRKAAVADLKPIDQSATLAEAEAALEAFAAQWNDQYPAISQIWLRYWDNIPSSTTPGISVKPSTPPMPLSPLISPPETLRERSLRKVIKTKAIFPDEESMFKLMYLAMTNIAKRWTRPIKNWKAPLSHFATLFPERFKL